jgi:hypothetical protein
VLPRHAQLFGPNIVIKPLEYKDTCFAVAALNITASLLGCHGGEVVIAKLVGQDTTVMTTGVTEGDDFVVSLPAQAAGMNAAPATAARTNGAAPQRRGDVPLTLPPQSREERTRCLPSGYGQSKRAYCPRCAPAASVFASTERQTLITGDRCTVR